MSKNEHVVDPPAVLKGSRKKANAVIVAHFKNLAPNDPSTAYFIGFVERRYSESKSALNAGIAMAATSIAIVAVGLSLDEANLPFVGGVTVGTVTTLVGAAALVLILVLTLIGQVAAYRDYEWLTSLKYREVELRIAEMEASAKAAEVRAADDAAHAEFRANATAAPKSRPIRALLSFVGL